MLSRHSHQSTQRSGRRSIVLPHISACPWLLSNQPTVISNLAAAGAELHIIGRDQVTSDLPEHRHLKGKKLEEYHGLTVDERTRGLGGLLTSCGEENLLKLEKDRYKGRDICVHEFAHNIRKHGIPKDIRKRFDEQYRKSLDKGLWQKSYAGSNPDEFFAELTMWLLWSARGPAYDRNQAGEWSGRIEKIRSGSVLSCWMNFTVAGCRSRKWSQSGQNCKLKTENCKFESGVAVLLLMLLSGTALAGTATITVDSAKPGPRLNPRMYGIFFGRG